MEAPKGWAAIKQFYSWPDAADLLFSGNRIILPEGWEEQNLRRLRLSQRLLYLGTTEVSGILVHRWAYEPLRAVLDELVRLGLWNRLVSYGGCYNPRMKRVAKFPSMHAMAAAVDFNMATNQLGTAGDMPRDVIQVFEQYGWTWGGRYRTPDPMHFQFGSDY